MKELGNKLYRRNRAISIRLMYTALFELTVSDANCQVIYSALCSLFHKRLIGIDDPRKGTMTGDAKHSLSGGCQEASGWKI